MLSSLRREIDINEAWAADSCEEASMTAELPPCRAQAHTLRRSPRSS